MGSKKTLYEVLGVAPSASPAEIKAAYQHATQKLEAENTGLNAASIELELKLVKMAFQTLGNQKSRQAYDSRLNPPAARAVAAPHAVPPPLADADAMSLQAAAASLKADAASLMAEAALLKADAVSLNVDNAPKRIAAAAGRGLKFVFTVLGGVGVVIVALLAALFWVGSANRTIVEEEAKARERVIIQEYYQTHGVRPKSKTEVELLEAESQRAAKAEREAMREKQKEQQKELEYQRFIEDSRRLGEQVSAKLQRDKEQAERQARYEAEKARQEQHMKEEAERRRIENERRKLRLN